MTEDSNLPSGSPADSPVKVAEDRIKGLDKPDQLLLFGSAAVFVLGFLAWYTVATMGVGTSFNGYQGGVGWLCGVSSAATVALLMVPTLRETVLGGLTTRLTKQVLFGLATVTLVFGPLRMLFSSPVQGMPDMSNMSPDMREMFSAGRTLWFWLALIAAGAAAYGAYQSLRAEMEKSKSSPGPDEQPLA